MGPPSPASGRTAARARRAHVRGDVVYEDPVLRISQLPGRGHGVTAVRGFKAGDASVRERVSVCVCVEYHDNRFSDAQVVLMEAPFVRVPTWLPPAEAYDSPYGIHELVGRARLATPGARAPRGDESTCMLACQ